VKPVLGVAILLALVLVPVVSGASSVGMAGRILVGTDTPLPGSEWLPRLHIAVVDVPDVTAALASYRRLPGVRWVEADERVAAAAAPDDPYYPLQWYLEPSGRDARPPTLDWEPVNPAVQGSGALVAVLDTGFEAGGDDQPVDIRTDLERNFVSGGTDVSDDNGHGTFVTNIIGEATGNKIGAAGVAPLAGIVPIKVLGADGTGDLADVAAGINYAASIGATVINLSLAGDQSTALCDAVAAASSSAVVIAASGNESSTNDIHGLDDPADCPGAIAVGSVAYDGSRPAYANAGCGLSVVAPGGDDLGEFDPSATDSDWVLQESYDVNPADGSLDDTFQYFQEEGTSMSAAEVTGEAALLMGLGVGVDATRRLILGTARPGAQPGVTALSGAGSVDIATAVADAQRGDDVNAPIRGYRLVTPAGAVQSLNDACETDGALGGLTAPPAHPVVGAAATPDGDGYWLVAADGGIFNFGDADFYGSTGAIHLNQPIVGMAATPDGKGYWLVAADGGIFNFGDAPYEGSAGGLHMTSPVIGIVPSGDGLGYAIATAGGAMYPFGDAPSFGNAAGGSFVGVAPEPWPGQ
jgi:hypothetical protein